MGSNYIESCGHFPQLLSEQLNLLSQFELQSNFGSIFTITYEHNIRATESCNKLVGPLNIRYYTLQKRVDYIFDIMIMFEHNFSTKCGR